MCSGIIERQIIHRGSYASPAGLMIKICTFVRGGNDGCPSIWPMAANQIAAKAQPETN
jgi:hypothetical protein